MREIWSPALFATALCVIVVVAMLLGSWEAAAPAFFCFLPVAFIQAARVAQSLSNRIVELERQQGMARR